MTKSWWKGIGRLALMLTLGSVVTASALAAVDLTGAGATFPYPLYSKWFDVYQQKTGVKINYQSIGSGGGIKQLMSQTVDFGASDAPLSDDEQKQMPTPAVHIPTVIGAEAVVYNIAGIGNGLHLTPEVLSGIYLGTVTRWNDPQIAKLNPALRLPNLSIAVAHRSDGSGTTYIFTDYLSHVSPAWKTKVGTGKSVNWPVGLGGKGNEGVAGIVKQTPGGIGYVELAYATQNQLTYAALRNRSGNYIQPGIASTTAAAAGFVSQMKKDIRVSIVDAPGKDAYPIAGFTYLLLFKNQTNQAKGQAVVDFLWWAIHDGQQHAAPLLYAPLPAAVVQLNEQAIKSVLNAGKPLWAGR